MIAALKYGYRLLCRSRTSCCCCCPRIRSLLQFVWFVFQFNWIIVIVVWRHVCTAYNLQINTHTHAHMQTWLYVKIPCKGNTQALFYNKDIALLCPQAYKLCGQNVWINEITVWTPCIIGRNTFPDIRSLQNYLKNSSDYKSRWISSPLCNFLRSSDFDFLKSLEYENYLGRKC